MGEEKEGKGTILLVEDEKDDVFLIKRALKKADVENNIEVLKNGESALSYLRENIEGKKKDKDVLPTLILLDLKLPKRSGLDVLKEIQNEPEFKMIKGVPIIILTSSKESSDIARAYELGANSYLIKPVSTEKMAEMFMALKSYWFDWNTTPKSLSPRQKTRGTNK